MGRGYLAIKVKHLLGLVLVLFLLHGAVQVWGPEYLLARARGLHREAAIQVLEHLLERYPRHHSANAVRRNLSWMYSYPAYVLQGSGGNVSVSGGVDLEHAASIITSLIHSEQHATEARRRLAELRYHLGDVESAAGYLLELLREDVLLEPWEARVLEDAGYPDRAREALERRLATPPRAPSGEPAGTWADHALLLAELELRAGRYEQARHQYLAMLSAGTLGEDNRLRAERGLQLASAPWQAATVRGMVWYHGEPMKDAVVVLEPADEGGLTPVYVSDSGRRMLGAPWRSAVGVDGSYEIPRVPPGLYRVYLFIRADRLPDVTPRSYRLLMVEPGADLVLDLNEHPPIRLLAPAEAVQVRDPEITFRWAPHPAAAYYLVGFVHCQYRVDGGWNSYGFALARRVTGTSVTFSREELFWLASPDWWHGSGATGWQRHAWPQRVLGAFYPGAEVRWWVSGYSADGLLVASSQGLGSISHRSLSVGPDPAIAADRLLLLGQSGPAVAIMEEQLAKDPLDHRARLWLARFYMYGDQYGWGQDRERARELYLELEAAAPTPWIDRQGR